MGCPQQPRPYCSITKWGFRVTWSSPNYKHWPRCCQCWQRCLEVCLSPRLSPTDAALRKDDPQAFLEVFKVSLLNTVVLEQFMEGLPVRTAGWFCCQRLSSLEVAVTGQAGLHSRQAISNHAIPISVAAKAREGTSDLSWWSLRSWQQRLQRADHCKLRKCKHIE